MQTSFLTSEGYQKLQEELEYLRTVKREQIANRLHEAIEGGELLDNAELEAAKNEQAFVEGSIKELEILLATARVVEDKDIDKETIQVGNRVTIQEKGVRTTEEYEVVGAAEADPSIGKISNESPMGKALLGKRVGDEVQIEAPAGAYIVKVLKVDLYYLRGSCRQAGEQIRSLTKEACPRSSGQACYLRKETNGTLRSRKIPL